MKEKNYYAIAIARYFSTPVPYFLLGSVPLMLYGYWHSELCFWIGLVITVLIFAINHMMMSSLTKTFGMYATTAQIDYLSNVLMGKCKVFSKQECDSMFNMIADLSFDDKFGIDDYMKHVKQKLESKAKDGNAEANYWLGLYHRKFSEEEGHNALAKQLIEKSADMGFEEAKNMLKRVKKWC